MNANTSPFFDAHNHLQDEWLAPHRDRVLDDLVTAGVRACVVNGSNEDDWSRVADLCRPPETAEAPPDSAQRPALNARLTLRPSFGLHPWDVGNRTPEWTARLLAQLDAHPNAAIGEIGLDRWMVERAKPDDPRLAGLRRAPLEEQIDVFRTQLALAAERGLPSSIHCLDAFGPLLETLQTSPLPERGFLLHAYSGSAEMAARFAQLGAYFSFNGTFVDPRKQKVRDVFAKIPAERLLVETDAPAMCLPTEWERFTLPPAPGGARMNHPANVVVAYEALAAIRGMSLDALTALVAENFSRLFGR